MRRECRKRFPTTAGKQSRHALRHVRDARAVMHAGIANLQFPLKSVSGKTFPALPVHALPAILLNLVRGPCKRAGLIIMYNDTADHIYNYQATCSTYTDIHLQMNMPRSKEGKHNTMFENTHDWLFLECAMALLQLS